MHRVLAGCTVLAAALVATAYVAFEQSGPGGAADSSRELAQAGTDRGAPTAVSGSEIPASPGTPEVGAADVAPGDGPPGPPAGASSACALDHEPGDFIETAGGPEGREYRLHVPPGYDGHTPLPLVVNFHGFGRSAAEQEAYSGLVPLADQDGFALATPEGSGYPPGWDIAGVYDEDGADDVAMTADLVAAVGERLCLDADRIYATGLSNGAEMASQVGCMLPDVFAAIAPVAGIVFQGCEGHAMPVITFHGTSDVNVPFASAPPAVEEWAAHNGCDPTPLDEALADAIERVTYSSCNLGADVVFYVVHGGGHTWPGAEDGAGGAGPTTHEIAASVLIWEFFVGHPRAVAAGRG